MRTSQSKSPPDENAVKATRAEFKAALIDMLDVVDELYEHIHHVGRRSETLIKHIDDGDLLMEVVRAEKPPLIVHSLSSAIELLNDAGARVRRAEARALYVEGDTMDGIAELFRVSRQRVARLLHGSGG